MFENYIAYFLIKDLFREHYFGVLIKITYFSHNKKEYYLFIIETKGF